MSRLRQYQEDDVLVAAKKRIQHIFDTHDTVAVMFSGGKDSLAALHLTREVAAQNGQQKVNVVFRDEELIPDTVIDFVQSFRDLPWVNMAYYAIPLQSSKYILGKVYDYIQWDPSRRHLRTPPEYAITLPEGDTRSFDQYTTDSFIAERYKGKVAFITGIRCTS